MEEEAADAHRVKCNNAPAGTFLKRVYADDSFVDNYCNGDVNGLLADKPVSVGFVGQQICEFWDVILCWLISSGVTRNIMQ